MANVWEGFHRQPLRPRHVPFHIQALVPPRAPVLTPRRPGPDRADFRRDVTYVPLQAVFLDRAGTASFVSTGNEVERREVKTGQFNDLWVQILEGLSPGETVLMSALPGLRCEGQGRAGRSRTGSRAQLTARICVRQRWIRASFRCDSGVVPP